ncbi:peptidoglycan editing factor PgeF [Ferrovum sp. PN-J185]|uniref:peptidoglycan editing factor PgeF n=1 Tax=Ferrovum sp. PN-J185 TaxID=1356306 RepID=UPI000791E548|nr:peptidoglycan editing factor PgeF [Ferrovum sp. PN-J185]KXW56333.1 laccase domain protein YfiH [Ferrovum sp. PN-J185]MCC6069057.1 peptidoglycan editing factor PgeF [Ferrovum sp. PN-J185]MDE1890963.1 peptidoglycan editing factor PgeF [Betaproteobacteria bacterium]MDE2055725.1 peptidoglycan editing factor PgeF [Betaproteobacteria bacterium]
MNEWNVNWPAPRWVKTFATTRQGGVSVGEFGSLNLGDHVHDNLQHVALNRQRVEQYIQVTPYYLRQVHGTQVVNLDLLNTTSVPEADAAFLTQQGRAAVVLTADCMPILFCHKKEKIVAVAHAGWRGLAKGVIGNTIKAMGVSANDLMVWIGPTIGQQYFEVGEEVRDAFVMHRQEAHKAFISSHAPHKWFADLVLLAKQQLSELGVNHIYGGEICNYTYADLFYSHRRDQGKTGRMGFYIWLDAESESVV